MFRATADYNGTKPTISLKTGDVLSAVHAVDDKWYIGHNDRSGETGAFPASFVEVKRSMGPKPLLGHSVPTVRFESKKLKQCLSTQNSLAASVEDSNQLSSYDDCYAEYSVTIGPTENIGPHGKLSALKASTENLIASERDEKRCMKAILGIVGGLLLGACIFVIYHYIFGYSFQEVGIAVSVITLLMCICLAVSSFLRHVILLVIPNFFTGTGKAVMLSAIFALIIQYPVSNIFHNAKETGSSMACVIDIAVNQSTILEQQLASSVDTITKYIDKQNEDLKKVAENVNNAVKNINGLLYKITEEASDWVVPTEILRKECVRAIKDVKSDCDKLCADASFPLTEICKGTLCELLDQSTTVCDALNIDGALNVVKDARNVLQGAVDYFNVEIEVTGYYHGNVNSSTQSGAIQKEVDEDIGTKFDVFHTLSSIILKCLTLPLLIIMFVQSFWYLRSYLAKDGYDNVYITSQFRRLDKTLGKSCILPLKEREQNIYVNTRSVKLNKIELSYCWIGLMQVIFHMLMWTFVTLFDYALYYILLLVEQHGGIQLDVSGDSKLSIDVQGTGPAAEFYRIMIQGYDHDSTFNSSIDIESCLPNPQEPNGWMVPVFIILYVITVAVVMSRAYGMRLRRKCAANYCPEQEMARIDYLHKRIRHKRIGFLKFIRQQIMSSHKEGEVKDRLSFSIWLSARFPFCETLLPKKQKLECTSCGQHETSFNHIDITKCTGTKYGSKRCSAAYCRECLEALQNVCPLCSDKEDEVNFRE